MAYSIEGAERASLHYSVLPVLDAGVKAVDAAMQGSIDTPTYLGIMRDVIAQSKELIRERENEASFVYRSICKAIDGVNKEFKPSKIDSSTRNDLFLLINLHRAAGLAIHEGV